MDTRRGCGTRAAWRGVSTPNDIVKSARRGIDMFDCVLPARFPNPAK